MCQQHAVDGVCSGQLTCSGHVVLIRLAGGRQISHGDLLVQHHPACPGNGLLHDVCAKPSLQLLQLDCLNACTPSPAVYTLYPNTTAMDIQSDVGVLTGPLHQQQAVASCTVCVPC